MEAPMLLKDIMTKDVITVTPDTPLREAGRLMKEKRISGIPVVDGSGVPVGIITVTDILKIVKEIYQWQQIEKKATGLNISDLVEKESLNKKVGDVMTKKVFTLTVDKSVKDLMELVFTKNIHTVPIMENEKLVGVIGKRDLIYKCF
jgi:predicted transcriptional regulator